MQVEKSIISNTRICHYNLHAFLCKYLLITNIMLNSCFKFSIITKTEAMDIGILLTNIEEGAPQACLPCLSLFETLYMIGEGYEYYTEYMII